jgi:hypothetical protein
MRRGDRRLTPNLYDNLLSLVVAGPYLAYPRLDPCPENTPMTDDVREARDPRLTFRLLLGSLYLGVPSWLG